MKTAITASHSTVTRSPPVPFTAPNTNGSTNRLTASTRPAQAAAMVAVDWRPVSFQITARSIRPPSSGRPGSRLKSPTTRLAHRSWLTSLPRAGAGRRGQRQPRARRGHQEFPARRRRLALDLGEPAERVEQDPAHRQPVGARDQRVAQLVDEDRHVEQHDEGRGHDEPSGAVQGRGEVVGVDDDEDAGDHEPVRRDVHRDAERARDDDPRAVFPAMGWLLRRLGRLLRRRACHITDATWRAGRSGRCEVPPNVGGLPYGGAVDNAVLAGGTTPQDPPDLGGTHPPEPPRALSPSRAADFMTCPLLY